MESFPADTSSAALARRWLGGQLDDCAPAPDRDVAMLLLSELVTNSVKHAKTACTVRADVRDAGDRLRIEVADGSEVALAAPGRALTAESGRGLLLVAALALAWGWKRVTGGKVVWFELAIEPG